MGDNRSLDYSSKSRTGESLQVASQDQQIVQKRYEYVRSFVFSCVCVYRYIYIYRGVYMYIYVCMYIKVLCGPMMGWRPWAY